MFMSLWVFLLSVTIMGVSSRQNISMSFKPMIFSEFNMFVKSLFAVLLFGTLTNLLCYGVSQITNPILNMSFSKSFFLFFFLTVTTFSLGRMMGALVPKGTPMALVPMLSVLELVSILVRPFTLVIRITVNLLVGHLLLGGVAGLLSSLSMSLGISSFVPDLILGVFELAVAFIQAFIFTLLIKLYIMDHPLMS